MTKKNNRSISQLKLAIRKAKFEEQFRTIIIDMVTTDWNCLVFKPTELISLFSELTKNRFFDSESIELIVSYLPKNTAYSQIIANNFLVELIENDFVSVNNICSIYNKFSTYPQVAVAIAKNPLTPFDILTELIFSDCNTVIVAIEENNGINAHKLLRDKNMRNRLKYAKKLAYSNND